MESEELSGDGGLERRVERRERQVGMGGWSGERRVESRVQSGKWTMESKE